MNVLGIDPAVNKRIAITLMNKKGMVMYINTVAPDDKLLYYELIHIGSDFGDFICVIEDQFVFKNWYTSKQIIAVKSKIEGILSTINNCKRIVNVNPRTWQAKILGKGNLNHGKQKARSLEVAKAIIKDTPFIKDLPISEDIADSVCICRYGVDYCTEKVI